MPVCSSNTGMMESRPSLFGEQMFSSPSAAASAAPPTSITDAKAAARIFFMESFLLFVLGSGWFAHCLCGYYITSLCQTQPSFYRNFTQVAQNPKNIQGSAPIPGRNLRFLRLPPPFRCVIRYKKAAVFVLENSSRKNQIANSRIARTWQTLPRITNTWNTQCINGLVLPLP